MSNKAKTRDELVNEAARNFVPYDFGNSSEEQESAFIEGAKWADQNPPPEVQGLLDALERIKTLTYSWVIAEQTKDCRHTYGEIKNQVDNSLETYRKVTSKE